MKKLPPFLLYFFVASVNLFANLQDDQALLFFSKISLMPALAFALFRQVQKSNFLPFYVLLAVFFSWIGDILLIFEGELFFIMGLLSFLTAHILYVLAFASAKSQKYFYQQNPLLVLPFVVFGGLFLGLFRSNLGAMFIPVLVYAVVILTMSLFALGRYPNSSIDGFWSVFVGSLFFVVSDLSLATNRFIYEFVGAGVWVMFTYIVAQGLIVYGMGQEIREKYEGILP